MRVTPSRMVEILRCSVLNLSLYTVVYSFACEGCGQVVNEQIITPKVDQQGNRPSYPQLTKG